LSTGVITTFAGTGVAGFSGDGGLATSAQVNQPHAMVFDAAGNLLFSDLGNNRVRKIDPSGVISTIAGTGVPDFAGDGGPAINAHLNTPRRLVIDPSGNLYIGDAGNRRIRVVSTSGIISTIAGNGQTG